MEILSALLLVKDLIFSAKIKEALGAVPCVQARTIEEFNKGLLECPGLVVINLNIPGELPFEALSAALQAKARTVCFFSHVDAELKERAKSLGAEEITPRSKLIENLKKQLELEHRL